MDADVRAALARAKGFVADGWFGCNPYRREGDGAMPRCAIVAIGDATGSDFRTRIAATDALCLTLGLTVDVNAGSRLVRWNNAPERTQAEVVAAFDKALLGTDAPVETRELAVA